MPSKKANSSFTTPKKQTPQKQERSPRLQKRERSPSSAEKREADPIEVSNGEGSAPTVKRRKGLGVRVIGGRIYDSVNGKTCHQCRQKTIDVVASCKYNNGSKSCTQHYCAKCLLNRYGEKVSEVVELDEWKCPKCRSECNCSICLKKQGRSPTGILSHTAKATGFNSVADLLKKCPDLKAEHVQAITNSGQKSLKKSGVKDEPSADAEISSPSSNGNTSGAEDTTTTPGKKSAKKDSQKKKRKLIVNANGEVSGPVFNALLRSSPSKQKSASEKKRSKKSVVKEEHDIDENTNPEDATPSKPQKKKMKSVKSITGSSSLTTDNNDNSASKSKKKESKKLTVKNENRTDPQNETSKSAKKKEKQKVSDKQVKLDSEKKDAKKRKKTEIVPEEIVLPTGSPLTAIAGIDFHPEIIGSAIQLVEFCSAFNPVLGLKKGDAELMLRELTKGRLVKRGANSLIVQFQAKLLNLIEQNYEESPDDVTTSSSGKNSWLQILKAHLSDRSCLFSSLPSKDDEVPPVKGVQQLPKSLEEDLTLIRDAIEGGAEGYENLGVQLKLQLLIILCDDTLETDRMREFIENTQREYCEAQKESREEVMAAKKEEREAKQKIKDAEVAKLLATANSTDPLSPSAREALISKVLAETEKAVAAASLVKDAVSKLNKSRNDAVRTDPIAWSPEGRAFYRLKAVDNMKPVVVQDMGNVDTATFDSWFFYSEEEEATLSKHLEIRALIAKRKALADADAEADESTQNKDEEEKENMVPPVKPETVA